MPAGTITFSVFTKPWKMDLPALAQHVTELGFRAVELPVRSGYPVNPGNVATELPEAARILGEYGIRITSIAGPTDETTIAACAAAGVPTIRICAAIEEKMDYLSAEARLQREFDDLVPLLEKHGVTIGVQNHCDRFVANAMGLLHLIGKYDVKQIAAVWDACHNALAGEDPDLALDIIFPRLCMVNLKNAFWRRANGPEALHARWRPYWTSGRQGLASWPRVAEELLKREYAGVVCLTAEFSDEPSVDRLIAEDLAFAMSLFGEAAAPQQETQVAVEAAPEAEPAAAAPDSEAGPQAEAGATPAAEGSEAGAQAEADATPAAEADGQTEGPAPTP